MGRDFSLDVVSSILYLGLGGRGRIGGDKELGKGL
jgi:hypothetical protein